MYINEGDGEVMAEAKKLSLTKLYVMVAIYICQLLILPSCIDIYAYHNIITCPVHVL